MGDLPMVIVGTVEPKVPVCLPCFRERVSMTDEPPRTPGWPEAKCALCQRRTNHGIFMLREDVA